MKHYIYWKLTNLRDKDLPDKLIDFIDYFRYLNIFNKERDL